MFKTVRFILGIFTLIGLAMMILGGYLAYKNSEIEKNGVITTGRIVDLEESRAENVNTPNLKQHQSRIVKPPVYTQQVSYYLVNHEVVHGCKHRPTDPLIV